MLTGDDRAATIPGLMSYHTMGVREHNRIVNILRQYYQNTTEDNEALFQVRCKPWRLRPQYNVILRHVKLTIFSRKSVIFSFLAQNIYRGLS